MTLRLAVARSAMVFHRLPDGYFFLALLTHQLARALVVTVVGPFSLSSQKNPECPDV